MYVCWTTHIYLYEQTLIYIYISIPIINVGSEKVIEFQKKIKNKKFQKLFSEKQFWILITSFVYHFSYPNTIEFTITPSHRLFGLIQTIFVRSQCTLRRIQYLRLHLKVYKIIITNFTTFLMLIDMYTRTSSS